MNASVPSPGPERAAPTADQAARLRSLMRSLSPVPVPIAPPLADPAPAAATHPALQPSVAVVGPRHRTVCSAFTVAIASGKGGVGKTNLAVNLGHALAQAGLTTTILDGDLGLGNADLLCGLTAGVHLGHYLDGERSIEEVTLTVAPRLRLVPGASGVARLADLNEPRRAGVLRALAWIEDRSDIVLIDCGAGIGAGVLTLLDEADLAIAVTTPEPTAIADAYGLIKSAAVRRAGADNAEPSPIELVVNQADDERQARAVHARIAAVCDRFLAFQLPMLGWVPSDEHLPAAVRRRTPVLISDPRAPAARAVRSLSASIAQRAGRISSTHREKGGWVARLVRSVRGR